MIANSVNWKTVYQHWKSKAVPRFTVMSFNRERHDHYRAWVDKLSERGILNSTNPQTTTAAHLCEVVETNDDEIYAAFAILCCLINHDSRHDHWELKEAVVKRLSSSPVNLTFDWSRNSKHVLPHLDTWELEQPFRGGGKQYWLVSHWKDFVDRSADYWRLVAETLAIVRIPELMNFGSDEPREWNQHVSMKERELELQQLARLKQKYEAPPDEPYEAGDEPEEVR